MKITLKDVTRECGDCTLCCKVMGVIEDDFHKPQGVWCPHASKVHGCKIYDTRPSKCRDFTCLWLTGQFGDDIHRPDKIHGVVTATTDGLNWCIHEDAGWPGHARRVLKPAIETWLKRGPQAYVMVVCGNARAFFGDRRTFDALMANESPEIQGIDVTQMTVLARR